MILRSVLLSAWTHVKVQKLSFNDTNDGILLKHKDGNTQAGLHQQLHLMMGLEALALLLMWHFHNSISWSFQSFILLHIVSALKVIWVNVDVWCLKATLCTSVSGPSDKCVVFRLQKNNNFLPQASMTSWMYMLQIWHHCCFAFFILVCRLCFHFETDTINSDYWSTSFSLSAVLKARRTSFVFSQSSPNTQ